MEKINLSDVCQRYRARVIHITPLDDCYLLETNRGPKELRIWPRVDIMRWSFAWRERMVRQGFRDLERFIRTKDSKPYLVVGQRGITLTDHLRRIETIPLGTETMRQCGRVAAMMHASQRESSLFHAADFWEQEQARIAAKTRRAQDFREALRFRGKHSDRNHRFYEWLFPPLLERMQRCADLLRKKVDQRDLFVSHGNLHRDNWGMVNDKLFLRGFFQPVLSIAQRDTAGYLRDLFVLHEDLSLVEAFLSGYEEVRPLRQTDYTLLLAFMAYPEEIWDLVEPYIEVYREPGEARLARIEQAVDRQQAVDQLLKYVAERAEDTRSESKA
ncbi:phosphotransferase [Brevibacillus borstelensis]|uniref:phosphotransferase n=1 Tax=Brevibacillus borstelensis TaxID=45462 RepID=UPI0030C46BE1